MYTAGVMPEAENQHHGVDFAAQVAMFYHKVLASSASGFSFGALFSRSNCAVRTYVKQLGVRPACRTSCLAGMAELGHYYTFLGLPLHLVPTT